MSLEEIQRGFEFEAGLFGKVLREGYLYGAWPRTVLIRIEFQFIIPEWWQLVVFCTCRILPEGLKFKENYPLWLQDREKRKAVQDLPHRTRRRMRRPHLRVSELAHPSETVACTAPEFYRLGCGGSDVSWASLWAESVTYTANPTWGDIFESSKLKARTSLLPRLSEKRRWSFDLWALKQHSKMSPQVGLAVYRRPRGPVRWGESDGLITLMRR